MDLAFLSLIRVIYLLESVRTKISYYKITFLLTTTSLVVQ